MCWGLGVVMVNFGQMGVEVALEEGKRRLRVEYSVVRDGLGECKLVGVRWERWVTVG